MVFKLKLHICFISCFYFFVACQQAVPEKKESVLWHNQQRELRYHPDGKGFVITNGTHRFNRALYGSHSGFRVEAGDLPEFALYMPRMGGTLRLGLIQADSSKWLIDAKSIVARYEAGSMSYEIEDPILKGGKLNLQLLALDDADGMILKVVGENMPDNVELFWAFGGASGKRFSRDGDLGADPESSFYLKPEYCNTNEYFFADNQFNLYYGSGRSLSDNEVYENNYLPTPEEKEQTRLKEKKRLFGLIPIGSEISLSDATQQESPLQFFQSEEEEAPAITGRLKIEDGSEEFFFIVNPDTKARPEYAELPTLFNQADSVREKIASQIKIETPDKYINAVGATLSTAADAVWDGKSFMHGAIAWRMPLNGWRGAYAADWLGSHDRAKTHFRGYFEAQYTNPKSGLSAPDPETHLARQKEERGTAIFTDGYISRRPGDENKPHHYDMNLVFISQLLSHFRWTGDLDFLRESWPVLERHLAWEKRNFDANDDGLYDAYASIWASDALQYSGGGVTHSSAYNYRANRVAAELAPLIGEDPAPYLSESEKIKKAVDQQLWLPEKGWFGEYKDLLGNQLVHPSAAVWTVYHAIDEGLADPFQAYQATEYIDKNIPHIPVEAEGLEANKYYTISTTNWMPYTWSINNVALAEVLHTALSYWQSGRSKEAFELTKSSFLDYMFLGTSPGNFGQLSYYDAFRGELYRDFADPVAMASRALVEGLFGISPDLINQQLTVEPGWPSDWDHASIETPDVQLHFKREGAIDHYRINSEFSGTVHLNLILKAQSAEIRSVKLNGQAIEWETNDEAIGEPRITINASQGTDFELAVEWGSEKIDQIQLNDFYAIGDQLTVQPETAEILDVYDPQHVLEGWLNDQANLSAKVKGELGWRTTFVKLKQGKMVWWQPLSFDLRKSIEIVDDENQTNNKLTFAIRNNTNNEFAGTCTVGVFIRDVTIPAQSVSTELTVSKEYLVSGSNSIRLTGKEHAYSENVINWNIRASENAQFETVDLTSRFNDRVTHIFNEQYYSPRSPYPTLSIPVQGIGDWCSYRETEEIDDSGLRAKAGSSNEIKSPQGIPFQTPADEIANILFTSKWDNYPDSIEVPLTGKASHVYLLMAGSVHHMQINMTNGWVEVKYADGSSDELPLKSPDNWWPIEQDYYVDGFAFRVNAPQPPRLYLKTGEWHSGSYDVLRKNGTNKIEGGAASLLDLPLNPAKELVSLKLVTNTNDVVIGLMSATLKRN
jgi:hypothetical protein